MQAKKAFDESVQKGNPYTKRSSKQSKESKIQRYPSGDPLPIDPLGQKLSELFINGWDWIYAEAPEGQSAIEWKSIKAFPLSPIQMWDYHQDPDCLVGIRPKAQTRWIILDIDKGSPYHPSQDPIGLEKIRNALEDIGICRTLLNQSSHSGGLHLYCPLPEFVSSFWLSVCVKYALESISIRLKSGECEIFPNPKRYLPKGGGFSNYAAIRLPMQPDSGFIPLDEDLNPLPWTLETWFNQFETQSGQQDISRLKRAILDAKENFKVRKNRNPQSIANWERAIAQEKKEGWTGAGQTNEKLKCFACEARVFLGKDNLEEVADHIYQTAINSPGFQKYSRHTRDIQRRSYEVASWAMNYYWPYGSEPNRQLGYHSEGEENIINFTYHHQLKHQSQERIKNALNHLRDTDCLEKGISERAGQLIVEAKVSRKTLYKKHNIELWHPKFETKDSESTPAALLATNTPNELESPTNKGYLPLVSNREKKEKLLSFKVPSNKTCLLAPNNEGFGVKFTPDGATVALPPQGQKATKVAHSHSDLSPSTISNWDELKASLPASLQAKISRKQRQLALNLESNRSSIELNSSVSQSKLAFESKFLSEQNEECHQEPRCKQTGYGSGFAPEPEDSDCKPILSPQSGGESDPYFIESVTIPNRSPTIYEQQEFEEWYALAQQFSLVSDFEWQMCEYFVLSQGKWVPYFELSADFSIACLKRYLKISD